MPYIGIDLKDSITVGKLYSIHYFEYMSDFKFPGSPTTSGSLSAWTRGTWPSPGETDR